MWNIDKPIPKEWENRRSISAKEFVDWQNGKLKPKESKEKKANNGPKLRLNFRLDFATYQPGLLVVTVHEIPASQNDWKHWHWSVLAKETARWNEIITYLALSAKCPTFKKPIIRFRFFFPDNRERDRKNFESWKPLLDGLTRARVIIDDNYKVIKEEQSDMYVDRRNPRVEIVVREG